jgi:PAS domain-containing protein
MERVAMLSRDDLLGRCVMEVFPWFEGSVFHREYERSLASGRTTQFESYFEPLDVWVEIYGYPSAQGLAVYFQDVTDRKNARDALRASEERHRLFFEVSLDAVLQLEHDSGKILSVNPAACRMFGLTEAQIKNGAVAGSSQTANNGWSPSLRRRGVREERAGSSRSFAVTARNSRQSSRVRCSRQVTASSTRAFPSGTSVTGSNTRRRS